MYTFDTHMCSLPRPRAFWGTVCEAIGTRLTVTPTAADEVLRRESLETQREWIRRLRWINKDRGIGWDARDIRRLANSAAQTGRDWLRQQLQSAGGPYHLDRQRSAPILERQDLIDDALPDSFFDFESPNGIRDKRIVAEAFAGDYNLLVSNNINTIDVIGLTDWLQDGFGREIGVQTRILTPQKAIESFRGTYQKPREWLADVVAKASVTNPYVPTQAAMEMTELVEGLSKRGIDDIQLHLRLLLDDETVFRASLEGVKQTGLSASARSENHRVSAVADQLSRNTGLSQADLLAPEF